MEISVLRERRFIKWFDRRVSGSKVNTSFYCNICASTSMCPVTVSLSETVSRLGGDGRGRRWEGDSRPRDERIGPKQTQISSALLRRQGAEHRVLVDAAKPFKTTLQPGMYAPPPPFPIYPVTDTLFTLTLAHGDLSGSTCSLNGRSWSAHLTVIRGLIALNQLFYS